MSYSYREKPLAVYVFSNDYGTTEKVTNETSSGGVCINDAIAQIAGNIGW